MKAMSFMTQAELHQMCIQLEKSKIFLKNFLRLHKMTSCEIIKASFKNEI